MFQKGLSAKARRMSKQITRKLGHCELSNVTNCCHSRSVCITAKAFLVKTPRAQLEQDAQSHLHLIDFDFAVRTANRALVLYKQIQESVI